MTARLSLLAILLASLLPAATIQSSFNTTSEGWTVTNDGADTTVVYNIGIGNPPGSISRNDQTNTYMHFSAPAAFLGNQSVFAGGLLVYDMRQTTSSSDSSWFYRTVLAGSGLLLLYTQELPPDTAAWRTMVTPLTSDGWIVIPTLEDYAGAAATPLQFANVLANVTGLYITGDLISGIGDLAQLDNVTLTTTPEPGSFGVLAAALTALALAFRRQTRA